VIGRIAPLLLLAAPLAAQAPTTAPPPAASTGYGAWFGSIPNMDHAGTGILLSGTSPGSPAEKAGLERGDVILRIAGTPMVDLAAMVEVLRRHAPGDTVQVVYRRVLEEKTVKLVLGSRPAS
jgi:S1-C subfamily serine protease